MDVRRTAKRLLIGGALAAVVGLIGAIVTDSSTKLSYQVLVTEQSTSGRLPVCKPGLLVIDRTTGDELPCSGTPEGGFTLAERQEILKLSTAMAADGFDSVDEFKLSERATAIGLRHDTPTSSATWAFITLGILGGTAFASGIAVRLGVNVRQRFPRG
ncbi:hypothetical protein E1263_41590 [Kribbella antibiotica]|uniref:Uncharacterized protein n=1 Tax=Kribbella antibiotica TaxID=190195 RepID=A0A4R4YFQ9_9ACTN|nr:hypothetical protein [Kribbella antibiotica]TDD43526.1 hypothetical protein E1263_41590 [Kribbella antibiotica]